MLVLFFQVVFVVLVVIGGGYVYVQGRNNQHTAQEATSFNYNGQKPSFENPTYDMTQTASMAAQPNLGVGPGYVHS